jgi:tRNA U34 5-methylaminomethyl-2-thiouridine-forming methyltransferase MnmC
VFIEAGLAAVLATKAHVRIFEMGFGTGLNALLALHHCQQTGKTCHFETVEAFPVPASDARQFNFPAQLGIEAASFYALHDAPWNEPAAISPSFTLLKWQLPVADAPLTGHFDVVFFDAFAPSSQPELWESPILGKMYEALAPGGVFVTYCAKGVVKRTLRDVGFTVEGIPGPPGKREMTRATKKS